MKRKVLMLMLVMCAALSLVACKRKKQTEAATYTFYDYTTALANNWNPHTWETNSDSAILDYISRGFVDLSISDSENGIYQWIYEMATDITDVTKDHQADLEKYKSSLPAGAETYQDVEEGYVYEIKLNQDACWEDGTKITADDYIYSMQMLLNPAMKNYRANLYYAGESAIAGAEDYYYAGSVAQLDNGSTGAIAALADLTKDEATGAYKTADGTNVYIGTDVALTWLGGNALATYVNHPSYGANAFDVEAFNELNAQATDGLVVLNDATYALLVKVITAQASWGESEADAVSYFVYEKEYPEVEYEPTVGVYKVDDYTIRYVLKTYQNVNYFLTSCTSTWLVYKDKYEAGFDTTGELTTTNYGTSIETTMSYGPYKLETLQEEKQMVLVQNENWYGYTKNEDGSLYSETNFEVDGAKQQQYQTTKIVIDVMDNAAAKQKFLSGEMSSWTPEASELSEFTMSDQLYQVDETYTMSLFFNTDEEVLTALDQANNKNSVALTNEKFRKAMSLAIDRAEWVTATAGYKPAYSLMNSLYHYNIYEDPTSSYRSSEEAMGAIVGLYGVEYGAGKTYATLKEAYDSITGYNLSEAKALMKEAFEELQGKLNGTDIKIQIAFAAGALTSDHQAQVSLFNKFFQAAIEGSGFTSFEVEAIGNLSNRYAAVPAGEYAIGYGAWGGAAFYPFRNFQVYMDSEQYDINEAGCWDPSTETFTLTVNGEEVTMTYVDWSRSMMGTGRFASADFDTKLYITAALEEDFLSKYYRIPLAGSTSCSMLAYQVSYYTEDYNIMYGFGGLRLMKYNYTDTEWTQYVADNNHQLSYR